MILFYWSQVDEATRGPPEFIGGMNAHPATNFHNLGLTDTNEAVYPLRFLVQGMVLFKESLSKWNPHFRRDGMSNKNGMVLIFNCPDKELIHCASTLRRVCQERRAVTHNTIYAS
jgi:hypothetical protein